MYIKVRKLKWWGDCWDYAIYSGKKRIACTSVQSWQKIGGAVRAAVKLATDLGIEYQEGE